MKLSNRLIYFMGGFLIGICILIFIWDKKNTKFPYMPDARVINDVNSKNVHYSNKLHTAFAKNIITAVKFSITFRKVYIAIFQYILNLTCCNNIFSKCGMKFI